MPLVGEGVLEPEFGLLPGGEASESLSRTPSVVGGRGGAAWGEDICGELFPEPNCKPTISNPAFMACVGAVYVRSNISESTHCILRTATLAFPR